MTLTARLARLEAAAAQTDTDSEHCTCKTDGPGYTVVLSWGDAPAPGPCSTCGKMHREILLTWGDDTDTEGEA